MLSKALPIAVLRAARGFLVLAASAIMMSSYGSAADLRLRIDPTAARPATTPSPKSRKQLFEEFLQWRRQQSR
jgi:hypothetical protein